VFFLSFNQGIACTESQIAVFAMIEYANEGRATLAEKHKPNWTGKSFRFDCQTAILTQNVRIGLMRCRTSFGIAFVHRIPPQVS
jgi:hypothetical protein